MIERIKEFTSGFVEGMKGPRMQELHQEEKEIAQRQLGLTIMCLASLPLDWVNDAAKVKKYEKILEKVKKDGKTGKGIFESLPDLYPDVPNWLMVAAGLVDLADPSPALGFIAEGYQFVVDGFYNRPKNIIEQGKEVFRIAKENIEKVRANQAQINQARVAFAA